MSGQAKEYPTKTSRPFATKEESGRSEGLLSQKEIDSLLSVSKKDQGLHTGIQTLVDSRKVTYERLPVLEHIFEHLAHRLSHAMANLTGKYVCISLKGLEALMFEDYMDILPAPTSINIFGAQEWNESALLIMDSILTYSIVETLLGGCKGPQMARIRNRSYTSIERAVVERVVKRILEEFTETFSPVDPITFQFRKMETDPRMASIVLPETACILARFNIRMNGCEGLLEFLIPQPTLDTVRDKLTQPFMGDKFGKDKRWKTHLQEQLKETYIDLKVELASIPVSLEEIMGWEPGDRIVFKEKPDSQVSLICGRQCLLKGTLAQQEGMLSLEIEDAPRQGTPLDRC